MTAGIATLKVLKRDNPYDGLTRSLKALLDVIKESAGKVGLPIAVNHLGSMAGIFFKEGTVKTFDDAMASDAKLYSRFFHLMLQSGVYLAPSPYEALFMSTAHTNSVMDDVMEAARTCIATLSGTA